jgi:uncharacterized protein YkwD
MKKKSGKKKNLARKVKYPPRKKSGMKRLWKVVIVIAVILVILIGGFFGFRALQTQRERVAFTNGFQLGYAQAVVQLMNMSLSCQPVPLYAGNSTLEVIAVDCLQQQPQQLVPEQQ